MVIANLRTMHAWPGNRDIVGYRRRAMRLGNRAALCAASDELAPSRIWDSAAILSREWREPPAKRSSRLYSGQQLLSFLPPLLSNEQIRISADQAT